MGTVHFTSSDGQATLPANYTFTSGRRQRGPHLHTATLDDGRHPVDHRHRHGRRAPSPASSSGITVNAGRGHAPSPSAAPRPTTAGTRLQRHRDRPRRLRQHGHRLRRHGPLHQQRRPGRPAGQLHASPAATRAPSRATLKTAGTQTITATDTVDQHHHRHQQRHHGQRRPRPPTSRRRRPEPAPRPARAFTVTVTAQDPTTTSATGYAGTVHFTSSDGQATLPANTTLTNGTGTFSATLKTAGTQSITATDTVTQHASPAPSPASRSTREQLPGSGWRTSRISRSRH